MHNPDKSRTQCHDRYAQERPAASSTFAASRGCNDAGSCCVLDTIDRNGKTVSPSRQCFNEHRIVSGLAQSLSEALDCSIKTVIEVDKCVLRPQLQPQLFTGYNVAAAPKKRQKNLQWLLL